jgi:hypothetical protein
LSLFMRNGFEDPLFGFARLWEFEGDILGEEVNGSHQAFM